MTTAADPSSEFVDRPWMDPKTDPLHESEKKPKRCKVTWNEARAWKSAAHVGPLFTWMVPGVGLGVVLPLLIWQLKAKKDGDQALAAEAVEALNFQLNVVLASVALSISIVGLVLLPVLWIGAAVLMVMAAVKVYKGEPYRYPWIWRCVTGDVPAGESESEL